MTRGTTAYPLKTISETERSISEGKTPNIFKILFNVQYLFARFINITLFYYPKLSRYGILDSYFTVNLHFLTILKLGSYFLSTVYHAYTWITRGYSKQ